MEKEKNVKKNLLSDDYATVFTDLKRFRGFLENLESNDKHIISEIPKISVAAVDENTPPEIAGIATETLLTLEAEGKQYPIITTAMPSIKRRSELDTTLMSKLPPSVASGMYNIGLRAQSEKKCTIFLRGTKDKKAVLAVHSDRYVPFAQRDVFAALFNYLDSNFRNVEFITAAYRHDLTQVKFVIQDDNLLTKYRDELASARIPGAYNAVIELSLIMSDTGYSSIAIIMGMRLKSRHAAYPFAKPQLIPHRDKAEFKDIEDNINKIFSLAQEGMANLGRLMKIKLSCPVSAAKRITKKFGLPKSLINDILPELQIYEDLGTEITAHDFYRIITKITEFSAYIEYSDKKKLEIKNNLSKIAFISDSEWGKYDRKI